MIRCIRIRCGGLCFCPYKTFLKNLYLARQLFAYQKAVLGTVTYCEYPKEVTVPSCPNISYILRHVHLDEDAQSDAEHDQYHTEDCHPPAPCSRRRMRRGSNGSCPSLVTTLFCSANVSAVSSWMLVTLTSAPTPISTRATSRWPELTA